MSLRRSSFIVGSLAASLSAQATLPAPPGTLSTSTTVGACICCARARGRRRSCSRPARLPLRSTSRSSSRSCNGRIASALYDRAGMGWSDPLPAGAIAAERDTPDLHALLTAAKESAPFVLVGASHGGLLIRHYLAQYPAEVSGLVFVDPSTEDRLFSMVRGEAFLIAEMTPDQSGKAGRLRRSGSPGVRSKKVRPSTSCRRSCTGSGSRLTRNWLPRSHPR